MIKLLKRFKLFAYINIATILFTMIAPLGAVPTAYAAAPTDLLVAGANGPTSIWFTLSSPDVINPLGWEYDLLDGDTSFIKTVDGTQITDISDDRMQSPGTSWSVEFTNPVEGGVSRIVLDDGITPSPPMRLIGMPQIIDSGNVHAISDPTGITFEVENPGAEPASWTYNLYADPSLGSHTAVGSNPTDVSPYNEQAAGTRWTVDFPTEPTPYENFVVIDDGAESYTVLVEEEDGPNFENFDSPPDDPDTSHIFTVTPTITGYDESSYCIAALVSLSDSSEDSFEFSQLAGVVVPGTGSGTPFDIYVPTDREAYASIMLMAFYRPEGVDCNFDSANNGDLGDPFMMGSINDGNSYTLSSGGATSVSSTIDQPFDSGENCDGDFCVQIIGYVDTDETGTNGEINIVYVFFKEDVAVGSGAFNAINYAINSSNYGGWGEGIGSASIPDPGFCDGTAEGQYECVKLTTSSPDIDLGPPAIFVNSSITSVNSSSLEGGASLDPPDPESEPYYETYGYCETFDGSGVYEGCGDGDEGGDFSDWASSTGDDHEFNITAEFDSYDPDSQCLSAAFFDGNENDIFDLGAIMNSGGGPVGMVFSDQESGMFNAYVPHDSEYDYLAILLVLYNQGSCSELLDGDGDDEGGDDEPNEGPFPTMYGILNSGNLYSISGDGPTSVSGVINHRFPFDRAITFVEDDISADYLEVESDGNFTLYSYLDDDGTCTDEGGCRFFLASEEDTGTYPDGEDVEDNAISEYSHSELYYFDSYEINLDGSLPDGIYYATLYRENVGEEDDEEWAVPIMLVIGDIDEGHNGSSQSTTGFSVKTLLNKNDVKNPKGENAPPFTVFKDSTNHWSEPYIEFLYANEIIKGYADKSFGPENEITRAELVKIAIKAFDIPLEDGVFDDFTDVSSNDWYAKYIETAYQHKIIKGYDDKTFRPNDPVTRADAMKILMTAAGIDVSGAASDRFSDVPAGSWYAPYVNYAKTLGVVGGYTDGTFGPGNNLKRGEVAKIVSLLLMSEVGDTVAMTLETALE